MAGEKSLTREEMRARGIAAMGRVERDSDGFTVYSTAPAPDAFRVWDDQHAGRRCTCGGFAEAFARGDEYECEHILAVALWLDPPDEAAATADRPAYARTPKRRVV